MPAGYQDQFLEQGTTFISTLNLDDNNGTPYNLTGFTIKAEARKSFTSANVVIEFVPNILDANNGVIELSANSAVTANVKSRKLVYDVIIKQDSTGVVTRILEGQIFVSPSVTRNA